jgi:hypothetical protein
MPHLWIDGRFAVSKNAALSFLDCFCLAFLHLPDGFIVSSDGRAQLCCLIEIKMSGHRSEVSKSMPLSKI